MPEQAGVLKAVWEWVEKAESDLASAAILLKAGVLCPTDTTCFHAQQGTEKYIKALLVLKGRAFAKIHDIGALVELVSDILRIDVEPAMQDRMTDYATVVRYPGEETVITLAEARRAVRIARRVRSQIRKMLPKGALPPVRRNIRGKRRKRS
jgi:HEPN domain-containing protein